MPNPQNAEAFDDVLDPADIDYFETTISQGDAVTDILRPGEGIAAYTLSVTAEAAAAGLQVLQTDGRAPTLTGRLLRFWVGIAAGSQANDVSSGAGVELAIELTITTDSDPYRRRQKTMLIKVAQQ